jgi:hypothetical protein
VLQLPHCIELHDSCVVSAAFKGETYVIEFAPAYVHRDGKGWNQNARLLLRAAVVQSRVVEFPAAIVDGTIETARGPFHNLLMLPLEDGGPVRLKFEFFSGAVLRATAKTAAIELTGQPTFVEDFG